MVAARDRRCSASTSPGRSRSSSTGSRRCSATTTSCTRATGSGWWSTSTRMTRRGGPRPGSSSTSMRRTRRAAGRRSAARPHASGRLLRDWEPCFAPLPGLRAHRRRRPGRAPLDDLGGRQPPPGRRGALVRLRRRLGEDRQGAGLDRAARSGSGVEAPEPAPDQGHRLPRLSPVGRLDLRVDLRRPQP